MATDRLINQTQGEDIIDQLHDIAANVGNITYGPQTSSDKVVSMTGYAKASTEAAISQGDTLNEAVGKLEKKADDALTGIDNKVTGPESAVVGDVAVFNNVNGKVVADSAVSISTTVDNTKDTEIPTSKAVDTYLTGKGYATGVSTSTANNLVTFNGTDGKALKDSGIAVATSVTDDNTKIPTAGAVYTALAGKQDTLTTAQLSAVDSGIDSTKVAQIATNTTNIASVEDMICDTEFSTSTAYAVGDIVTYEHGLYKFNTAHSAGAWNSSQVDEVSAVDLIASGGGTDSVASKEIYTTKTINQPDTWETKTWTGLTSFYGQGIWSDGTDIYYSVGSTQYVLNKETSTWETKTWSGLTSFNAERVWTDGTDIYYSYGSVQYILNKATSTWSTKTWSGLTSFVGLYVWTDGTDIYYSVGSTQYVLNKETSTWETKTWTGLTSFNGSFIWTDGENIYCCDDSLEPTQYVLNKTTSTWETKTWNGLTDLFGEGIWADGTDIYYSAGSNQYVLNKSTSTWSTKSWSGLTDFIGKHIWTDGTDIYYSYQSDQYVLKRPLKTTKIPDVKNNAQLTALIGDINSVLEAVL